MPTTQDSSSYILITKTYNNIDIVPPFYIAVDQSVASKIKKNKIDIRYVNDRGDDTACALIIHSLNGKIAKSGERSMSKLVTGRRYVRRKKVHGKNWRNFELSNYKSRKITEISQFASILVGRSNMKPIKEIDRDIAQLENKIKLLKELKQINTQIRKLD